ncbi:MAG TPA: response regulator transcription factor [Clostridiales bacterium]|nr:MAG: Response regulator MprA [Firmicutes bacterium ADurb.Bin262]HOU09685.1 response regulator transcription factor [Clostridiales bacterium]HQH63181.1 response regulator transcription factor [Clostridiales bacterium]HQK72839.1 response regulator transcription factor [Clostridiales bacterium]
MRILMACGEKALSQRLALLLMKSNHIVDEVGTPEDLLGYAEFAAYGVIVLDTNLTPDNGFGALKSLRKNKIAFPVLLISDKRAVADRVEGLDLGADDYLCKPFSADEFLARVRALSRRKDKALEFDTLSFGDIFLDLKTNELICNEHVVRLGLKEFQIMKLLIGNGRQIIGRERLVSEVWGSDSPAEYNNIEVYMSFLRKKLAKLGSRVTIRSIRGIGYHLMPVK